MPLDRARGNRASTVFAINRGTGGGWYQRGAGAKGVAQLPVVLPSAVDVVLGPADRSHRHVPAFAGPWSRALHVVLVVDPGAVVDEAQRRFEALRPSRHIAVVRGGQRAAAEVDLGGVRLAESCDR